MSQRFGRNQRRRAREALAAEQARSHGALRQLHAKMIELSELLEAHHGLRRTLDDHISSLQAILGAHATALGLPEVTVRLHSMGHGFRLPVHQRPQNQFLAPTPSGARALTELLAILQVEPLRQSVSRDLHCHVRLDDGSAGYAISHHALTTMPLEWLVQNVSLQLAYLLINEFKERHAPPTRR